MRDVGAVENAAMLVRDGKVQALGPAGEIKVSATDEVFDAEGGVVLPGFVDAHTHFLFGGNRADEFAARAAGATYEEIAASGGGILSTVAATRESTEEELVRVGAKRLQQFLEGGTTAVESKSGYGLAPKEELKLLSAMIALAKDSPVQVERTFLGAHAFPPEFQSDHEGYIELILDEMLPRLGGLEVAPWCDIFVEDGYYTKHQARRILTRAKEMGMRLRMHVDQLIDGGGAALAAELGAKTADHLEQTPAIEFSKLKQAGVTPVLLPASVFCLGKTKYPDARGMVEAGLPVVLATDFNPGSSPTLSMPFVMTLAMTQMRMTAEEALTACTINAAHSLDLGQKTGSLEPGKDADFTVWRCDDWREIPYWVAMIRPEAVFIRGKRVV